MAVTSMAFSGHIVRSSWTSVPQCKSKDTTVPVHIIMAKVISVHDLVELVAKLCPDGTPIPSVQWVRL